MWRAAQIELSSERQRLIERRTSRHGRAETETDRHTCLREGETGDNRHEQATSREVCGTRRRVREGTRQRKDMGDADTERATEGEGGGKCTPRVGVIHVVEVAPTITSAILALVPV